MSFQVWLAFAAATSVILVIPGPTILLVISYALGHGRRSAYATVAGVALGDFTAMTTAMFGLGALLATSTALFTALKWIGAAYLIYLGIKLWRAPADIAAAGATDGETKPSRIFLHAYVVTALNPKSIVFFVAFLPQFLDMAGVTLANMAIFEATFVVLAALNALSYALVASAARRTIRKPKVQRAVNRVGGSLLIGAGALAVGWKRAAA
jgi:threonine/homoserine/homoserine lactone efflux protein